METREAIDQDELQLSKASPHSVPVPIPDRSIMKMLSSLLFGLVFCLPANAQQVNQGAAVVKEAASAAAAFLQTLSNEQVQSVRYKFTDEKQRHSWSNLPTSMVDRGGLSWGSLNGQQRESLTTVLKATLSKKGYQQVVDNMDGDEMLNRGGRQGGPTFGRDEYYVSILGQPSESEPWMLMFGGHHLAINATFAGDEMTISPSLTGGQPIDFTIDGRTVRQLAEEEDKSFELIGSMTADQKKQAVLGNRYTNMKFGPGEEGATPKPEGINAGSLQANQQKLLLELIGERMALMKEPFAMKRMTEIEGDLGDTWLSWYGDTKMGGAATFRIQGPTILMEYSPQRLGGKPTDHTHAMYRNPTNDYGVKFVKASR